MDDNSLNITYDYNLKEFKNRIILLSSNYNEVKTKEQLGIISFDIYSKIKSKNIISFSNALDDIGKFNYFASFIQKNPLNTIKDKMPIKS